MARLELSYPVNPHKVNRGWGVSDVFYEQFGFKKHNGVDLALVDGQIIRSPFNGEVKKIAFEPQGGGLYICLLSTDQHDFDDGKSCWVEITFMHLQRTIARVGDILQVGDVVAYGDNTGAASKGSHTHMAPKRVIKFPGYYSEVDENDACDTFDPEPYWTKNYAIGDDKKTTASLADQITAIQKMIDDFKRQTGK